MIKCRLCPTLSSVLESLREIVKENEKNKKRTLIFCEDRLTLVAERTVCGVVGGTFSVSVFTFARFLSAEQGKNSSMLSSQGSAMAIRRIIEENRGNLKLFGRLSSASAAGAVYDTVSLLFSSKISPEDVKNASVNKLAENKMFDISNKLCDVALIYSEYEKYLKESGKTDRNAFLSALPKVIGKSEKLLNCDVVFLGFQSFTKAAFDCVKATFERVHTETNNSVVHGLFIGGNEEIYVNEGYLRFVDGAKEYIKSNERKNVELLITKGESTLNKDAEKLRISLFNPLCNLNRTPTDRIHIFEGGDSDEEIEFIARNIKRHISDGERFAKISVMLPNMKEREKDIKRIFSKHCIPYYADRRYTVMEHSVCAFILSYLSCALTGCAFKDCDMVVSSPMFPIEFSEKDEFRNYLLRFANYRGGIRKEPNEEICQNAGFDYQTIKKVWNIFWCGLNCLISNGSAKDICNGIRNLLKEFNVKEKLESLYEKHKDEHSVIAAFNSRVYDGVLSVLSEAEEISVGDVSVTEFIKILKSGFTSAEISLIPPKADAVFVGDIGSTVNSGSNVVFAAGLTGSMLDGDDDTSLLTDREISALENLEKNKLLISPKIRQVGLRRRETIALNICAFREHLYLTYAASGEGEESGKSEVITLANSIFCKNESALNGEKVIESIIEKREEIFDNFEKEKKTCSISNGGDIFLKDGGIYPTVLETYFACPYKNFMQNGLNLQEREEGVLRPADAGNFIHSVLQTIAPDLASFHSEDEVAKKAKEIAEKQLNEPKYSSIKDSVGGDYAIEELIKEGCEVCKGAYEQLINSRFAVEECEKRCDLKITDKLRVHGRIDRVDSFKSGVDDEAMIRVIDYKTGTIDPTPTSYYMGLKLQLPLYLLAVSKNKRAVGAYYFPAALEYRNKNESKFKLQGFMDSSEEVIHALDKNLQFGNKSEYFNGEFSDKEWSLKMNREEFADFLEYSKLIAERGASEMLGGNITPSPIGVACEYCKMGGSCGFCLSEDDEARKSKSVKCKDIINIVKKVKGENA